MSYFAAAWARASIQASERGLADFIAARLNTKVHLNRLVRERLA